MKERRSTIAPFSCAPDFLCIFQSVFLHVCVCVCVSVVAYDRTQESSSPACDPHKALERGSLYLIKS